MKDDREKLIIATLDKIRHFLQRDGGDVSFVSFDDGVVYVTLHGACQDCAYANNDIKDLVEVILQEEVPGVTEVRLYNPSEDQIGVQPSGKAVDSEFTIHWFDPSHPSQK